MSGKKYQIRNWQWVLVSGTALLLILLIALFMRMYGGVRGDIEDHRFLLDTVVTIKLFQSNHKEVLEEAFTLIEKYENQLSHYRKDSEISLCNAAPAGVPTAISDSTRELIKSALYYANLSDGRFDPTIAPITDLWGIGSDNPYVPSVQEIDQALSLVDYRLVKIDDNAGTITLEKEGMALDPGGITKGWIADQVGRFLIENGVSHFLVNLGGNVLVHGGKPGLKPFKIGMQNPFEERGEFLGVFSLREGSVVSSGIYERFFESGGIKYHHILSTSDGFPVENNLAAVTVISEKSLDGDALSTTVFTMGLDEGMKLIQSLDGVEAVFVTREKKVILSPGAEEIYKK